MRSKDYGSSTTELWFPIPSSTFFTDYRQSKVIQQKIATKLGNSRLSPNKPPVFKDYRRQITDYRASRTVTDYLPQISQMTQIFKFHRFSVSSSWVRI